MVFLFVVTFTFNFFNMFLFPNNENEIEKK